MNPWFILGLVIMWICSLGGAFWFGEDYCDGKHAKLEVQKKEFTEAVRAANQDFADQIGTDVGKAIRGIRVTSTTVNNEIRHERETFTKVLDNPDCAVPPSTVRVLNNARGYAAPDPSASKPTGGVSAPAPAAGGKAAAGG